jgi:toxin CcdB
MARFDVYTCNRKTTHKYLLDVQADILQDLKTRVVVPLAEKKMAAHEKMDMLKPVIDIDGQPYTLMTTELAAIPASYLDQRVGSVENHRHTIVKALDFLFQGF